MTELGIKLRVLADGDWMSHVHSVLDDLPPAFTSVWLPDHLMSDGAALPETWTRLTWLAATFPRYRVGGMVLNQAFRNRGLLGVMAATLQDLSGGRLVLGMGAGWLEEEYRAFDFEYPSPGTRVAQLAETIELLRALWSESPATYHGNFFHLDRATCKRPDQPIPILVGTNGPKALKVVARLADWWVWDGPWQISYQRPYELLRSECEAIGRPFEDITLMSEMAVAMPDDASSFQPTYEHGYYPGQVFGISGPTAENVISDMEKLVEVGVKHIAIGYETLAELNRFVDEVVPRVRL
jgi:alkanesulfonate monooxygenase SsuD/methylene tetrahydromethanopterin reductase-like flavin-dependent oxidoreductase (luciferase family)